MDIKVGIIDDSLVVRSALKRLLGEHDDFEVVGAWSDVYEGRRMILETEPDVLTLDVEMPKMDGITFLKRLMEHHPLPVVMVSSLTEKSSKKGIEALEAGAQGVVPKPSGDSGHSIQELGDELIRELKAAYHSRLSVQDTGSDETKAKGDAIELPDKSYRAVLIGSSTGGVQVLNDIIPDLKASTPPIMVVQHMPPLFTDQFAKRLNQQSELDVGEGEDREKIKAGSCRIAPGDYHMVIRRINEHGVSLRLNQNEEVLSQRPAADPLFKSAAKTDSARNILGIVLTGMGKDGREGSRKLTAAGGDVITQDRESATVYGMPKEVQNSAETLGAADPQGLIETINQLS